MDGHDDGDQSSPQTGFTYVQSSKGKNAKRRNRKGRPNAGQTESTAEERLKRRIEIIESQVESLSKNSGLQTFIKETLSGGSSDQRKRLDAAINLGLGSVKDAKSAQIQLAFFLIVCRTLHIDEMHGYDPIWTDEDISLLKSFNMTPLQENRQGRYSLEQGKTTFVFMPHCTQSLNENLLRTNWTLDGLGGMLLCCNTLDRYVDGIKSDAQRTPCIHRAVAVLNSYALPTFQEDVRLANALNDLAFQTFQPLSSLLLSHSPKETLSAQSDDHDDAEARDGEDPVKGKTLSVSAPSSAPFWILPQEHDGEKDDVELL